MKHPLYILLLLMLGTTAWAQNDVLTIAGRVTCGSKGVPYATLQLKGGSLGVSCNDDGSYELKVPAGHEGDTVVIRSVGYEQTKVTVDRLLHNGNVRLKAQVVELQEVKVNSYRSGKQLIQDAVRHIDDNYQQQPAYSTFFYRDWRSLDGELYLFDEAVIGVQRKGYAEYARKMSYQFYSDEREMETNYKTLLRHRLLVYDRTLLESKVEKGDGVTIMMQYADNELFFDPVATPEATLMLADRVLEKHAFWPIQEFLWDGESYYLVRSVTPNKIYYEFTIRKSDLAIVRITSTKKNTKAPAPAEAWVNTYFNRLTIDIDTSSWTYDVRDGRYTLTHYYNNRSFRLSSSRQGYKDETQQWQECVDWTLTDFTPGEINQQDIIAVKRQSIASAFGESDYNTDFWGHYNSILIDTLPLRLLREKLLNNDEME